MECLSYCLRCFRDIEVWEDLVSTPYIAAVRCPYCQTVHTLYPDGTVRLNAGGIKIDADFTD